jgi:hypothetical protein
MNIDRNMEYARGWNRQRAGEDRVECRNEYQIQGWDEAKLNQAPAPKGAYATNLIDKSDDDLYQMVADAYHYSDPAGDGYMQWLFTNRKIQRNAAKELVHA